MTGVLSEIANPSRLFTGLHEHKVDFVFCEGCCEEVSIGCGIKEGVLAGFGVKEAAHDVGMSAIESENFHRRYSLGLGLGFVTRCVANAMHDNGFESPDFIRKIPTPNPGLTWILPSLKSELDDSFKEELLGTTPEALFPILVNPHQTINKWPDEFKIEGFYSPTDEGLPPIR